MSQTFLSDERFDKRLIPDQWKDMANWPDVDTEGWPESERVRFSKYESALFEYLADMKVDEVCRKYGIEKSLFYDALKRCLQIFPGEDRIYGKRALIKYTRIDDYTRKKPLPRYPEKGKEGLAGALTRLLKDHPKIVDAIRECAYKKGKGVIHENRIELEKVHKEFLNACRKEGIPLDAYPFNTEEKGKRALSHYLKVDLLKKENLLRGVAIKLGTKAAQKFGSGESNGFLDPIYPLQEGQIDGHRLDAKWTLSFPDRYWGFQTVPCADVSIICLKDKCSKAVFGYELVFSVEYSSIDIQRTLKAAIKPWKPMKFTIGDYCYPENGGIPSMLLPEYHWAPFDLIVCDNDMAHLAERTRVTLERKLGCAINYGQVYSRDHQSDIENLFRQFARNFQQFPNTTGSDYKDQLKPKHPERIALHYKMTIFDLVEIVEMVIAIYNSTPQDSLDSLTPIEVLQRYAARPNVIIRKIREIDRNSLFWLDERKKVHVKGGLSEKRRPYINFFYAHYTSPKLANALEMAGKYITISFDMTKDARTVMAFLENGAELGPLTAMGQWSRSYHTFQLRQRYHELSKQKKVGMKNISDARQEYLEYIFNNIGKNQRAASEFAQFFYLQFKEFQEQGGGVESMSYFSVGSRDDPGTQPESENDNFDEEFISYERKPTRYINETDN